MSLKLLAFESCYHPQQRSVGAFLVQQIRARVLDMHTRQQATSRGRGRGEGTRHSRDRASSGDLNTPASALGGAKPDSSNNWSRDGVSRGSSVGASSQVAVIHQNRNRASFGGLTNPASALGETKPDSANTSWGHDEVGASRGSSGGLSNPASVLGDTKPDSVNANRGHDEVGVNRGSSVSASDQIATFDGVKPSYLNAVRQGSNAKQENSATSNQYQGLANRGGQGRPWNEVEPNENLQTLGIHEVESDLLKRVGPGRNVRHENFAISNRDSGSNRRQGGRGRRWNEREPSEDDRINALGRTLVKILRHQASELGLRMRDDGFVKVMDLLRLPIRTGVGLPLSSHTIEDFHQAVKQDNKQRLGIIKEDESLWIRANQGHSLKVIDSDKLLKPIENAEEIQVCVHGTYMRFLPSILSEGLRTMDRIHIHFATGLPKDDGVISGMRKTCEVLIYLDVARALSDNMKLYISENGVILTEGFDGLVPPEYFAKIVKWPERTQIPLQKFKNAESSVHHQ